MKNLLCISFFLFTASLVTNCKKDNSIHRIHIHQPTSDDKYLGEVLPIEVEFETLTGPVEHINIKIMNAARTITVYDKPFDPHTPGSESIYIFEDHFSLSSANGMTSGDWVLEAKVYRDEDGKDEVIKSVEFHVNL